MSILSAFLTLVLIVNCLFLILLVLIQLPKKEAGAGLAFGAGATDALFGSGSGNALTKLTKYSAVIFLGLSLVVSLINSRNAYASSSTLREKLATVKPITAPAATPAPAAVTNQFKQLTPTTNALLTTVPPAAPSTNVSAPTKAAAPTTNNPAPATK